MSSRRQFLQHSALLGSGLALACFLPTQGDTLPRVRKPVPAPLPPGAEPGLQPHVLLRIDTQGHITLVSKLPEMGQGVKTSLPMLIAEELEADWREVQVVQADFDTAYGPQTAGGSQSVPQHFDAFLRVGAMARTLLLQAAADTWLVPVATCHAQRGVVHHAASGRQLRYGELAARADKLPLPDAASVVLKPAASRKLLGTRVPGVDNVAIVTGQRLFGIDVALPGMLHACFVKAPAFGAGVRQANLDEVKRQPGVRDAFVIDREAQGQDLQGLMPGVAIVAESTWAAQRARRALRVVWDEGPHLAVTREHWQEHLRQAQTWFDDASATSTAQTVRRDGDVAQALAQAAHRIEATYQHPFLPHATLEPQNATAWWRDGRIELWAPIQHPAGGVGRVARLLGIPARKVTLHLTRCGGGFGRRLGADYLLEAAVIARRVNAPVKLSWTREDDLQHDHYRAGGMHRLRGGVDAQGRLIAWEQHAVGFANPAQRDGTGPLEPGPGTLLGGNEFPASLVPHGLWVQHTLATGVPLGAWRSPGSNVFAWVSQSFLDELAHAAGQDPLAFRLALLQGTAAHADPHADLQAQRQRGVLNTAAQAAGWGTPLPPLSALPGQPAQAGVRRGRGIASHSSQGGHAAMVAEVSVSREGQLRVDRIVAAVDVGEQIVNLSGAEQQVQGAVIDGLSALWHQGLDIDAGRIVQSNFHDHKLLRLPEAPARIDVHFVRSPQPSTGLGEPALPPVAPAICNAIFAATGVRVRDWPLSRTPLR